MENSALLSVAGDRRQDIGDREWSASQSDMIACAIVICFLGKRDITEKLCSDMR